MRLPNGFGSVYKMAGNRRKPWAARKTVGWDDKGHPRYLFIGFYETRKEALEALSDFNRNPYDKSATFALTHKNWAQEAYENISERTRRQYESVSHKLEPLMPMKMADIRLAHMQAVADSVTDSMGATLKVVLRGVFNYAVRNEIVPADRAELVSYIKTSKVGKTIQREVFSEPEIKKIDDPLVLILLYTGLRVGELLALESEDIHLEERWLFVKQAKTKAGIRKVPIAEKIVPYFSALPTSLNYDQFRAWFVKKYEGHRPHDTRHTFISRLADIKTDERIIKQIVGHAGEGVTETVYTHLDLSVLREAVNRLE